jgi:hypothetical protein
VPETSASAMVLGGRFGTEAVGTVGDSMVAFSSVEVRQCGTRGGNGNVR